MAGVKSPFLKSREQADAVSRAASDLLRRDPMKQSSAAAAVSPALKALKVPGIDQPSASERAMLALAGHGGEAGSPIRDELKYANFTILPVSIDASGGRVLLRPTDNTRRVYLAIINTHATQNMFLNFDGPATTLFLPINASFGVMEYNIVVPQNDVFLIASGAATTGVVIYANDAL